MNKARTIAGENQLQWPEELNIVSHTNDNCTWHIPLPPKDQVWELSQEELQKIASGETLFLQASATVGIYGLAVIIAGLIGTGILSAATGAFIGAVAAK